MTSLLSTIFGDVRYDRTTDAYYWHPWLDQEPYDGRSVDDRKPEFMNDE